MKRYFLFLFILFTASLLTAQTLQSKGDTVFLIERGQEIALDSIQIEFNINHIKQNLELSDNNLLRIEALRAKELEKKIEHQTTLIYLQGIREKYNQIKRETKKSN
jgi:hypothetical protein